MRGRLEDIEAFIQTLIDDGNGPVDADKVWIQRVRREVVPHLDLATSKLVEAKLQILAETLLEEEE